MNHPFPRIHLALRPDSGAKLSHTLAEEAERHGLIVALENMPKVSARQSDGRISYGIDPATVAAQIRAVGHPALTGCLDLSHAAIAAIARGADLATDIHAMTPEIGHIHLHD